MIDLNRFVPVDNPPSGWDSGELVSVPPEQQDSWIGPFLVAGTKNAQFIALGSKVLKADQWFKVLQPQGIAGVRLNVQAPYQSFGPLPGKDGGWPYGTLVYGVNGGPYHGWIVDEKGQAYRPATAADARAPGGRVTTGTTAMNPRAPGAWSFSPQTAPGGWGLSNLDLADLAELLGSGIGALTSVPPPPPAVGVAGEPTNGDEGKNLQNLVAYDLADAQHAQRDFQIRVGADIVALVVQRRSMAVASGMPPIRIKDMVREAGPVVAALNALPAPPPIIGERLKDWNNYFVWRDSLAQFFKKAEQLTAASLAAAMVVPSA